jgi:hypothetical protein
MQLEQQTTMYTHHRTDKQQKKRTTSREEQEKPKCASRLTLKTSNHGKSTQQTREEKQH